MGFLDLHVPGDPLLVPNPDGVAETVHLAREAGLAGCSVEDSGRGDEAILDAGLARERVAAAVEAAGPDLVLTARAENLLHCRGAGRAGRRPGVGGRRVRVRRPRRPRGRRHGAARPGTIGFAEATARGRRATDDAF